MAPEVFVPEEGQWAGQCENATGATTVDRAILSIVVHMYVA